MKFVGKVVGTKFGQRGNNLGVEFAEDDLRLNMVKKKKGGGMREKERK